MALSAKAQDVRDYIVGLGTNHWAERAKAHSQSAQSAARDVYGFVLELQAAFGNKFSTLNDQDWEDLADWFFTSAQS